MKLWIKDIYNKPQNIFDLPEFSEFGEICLSNQNLTGLKFPKVFKAYKINFDNTTGLAGELNLSLVHDISFKNSDVSNVDRIVLASHLTKDSVGLPADFPDNKIATICAKDIAQAKYAFAITRSKNKKI